MCGIFAYITQEESKISLQDLDVHFQKIKHRGPNDSQLKEIALYSICSA